MLELITPRRLSYSDESIAAIAWPTVVLFIVAFANWLYTLYYASFDLFTIISLTLSTFLLFTPMHEAVHCSIFPWKKWNNAIGILSSLCFAAPFSIFRRIHLAHHNNINNPEKDPDSWSGKSYPPLRWLTQESHYYYWYLSRLPNHPKKEVLEMTVWIVTYITIVYMFPVFLLKFWILPGRIAGVFIIYTFDYLPHRPHISTDKYLATNVTSLFRKVTWPLTLPLLHQNYHIIHHLYPKIPFYKYSGIWKKEKAILTALGTKTKPIISLPARPNRL